MVATLALATGWCVWHFRPAVLDIRTTGTVTPIEPRSTASLPPRPISVAVVPAVPSHPEFTADWHTPGVDETEANRLVGALVQQPPPGLAHDLDRIARDPAHTLRWRNYVVQHLTDLAIAGDRTALTTLVWAAQASEPMVREAGVFGLARANASGLRSAEAATRSAVEAALSQDAPDQVQVAAIRGLVLLERRDMTGRLLIIAGNRQIAVAVRVAAVDALGVLGSPATAQELGPLLARSDRQHEGEVLIHAMERSLKRLEHAP